MLNWIKSNLVSIILFLSLCASLFYIYHNEGNLTEYYRDKEKKAVENQVRITNDSIKVKDSSIVFIKNHVKRLEKENQALVKLIKQNKQKSDVKIQVIKSASNSDLIKHRDSLRATGFDFSIH